jgi:16S rRNA (adenine1518-N6/adenine1519-N6)-dimethyltransferase
MNLSEMKQILAQSGIRLTKSLGQNFLHDANQLRRIIAAADLRHSDKVLEIGPGLGPLTEFLLKQVGAVLAIEKDARLIEILSNRLENRKPQAHQNARSSQSSSSFSIPIGSSKRKKGSEDEGPAFAPSFGKASENEDEDTTANPSKFSFTLLHDDALAFLKRAQHDWHQWKLVSNLPYSVASPILVELALTERPPERMVATLQAEVARRLAARAANPDYGALTLLVQLSYEPRQHFKIPASCFFPEPDVDSACVSLVRRPHPLLASAQKPTFVKLVKRGFSQRRKMMLKLLKQDWPVERLSAAFAEANISTQARAEDVSLEQFVALANQLMSQ